jgi:acyl carrier protein
MPPLDGIIHAAGVISDAVVCELSWEEFQKVAEPKIKGAFHLHEHCIDLPLTFFVLFSSAANVLRSPGQANYAAANAYLDALARFRRRLGLPALCIDWGPWGMGMAAREPTATRIAKFGIQPISSHDAFQILGHAILGKWKTRLVLPCSVTQITQLAPWIEGHPLFSEIEDGDDNRIPDPLKVMDLASLPRNEWKRALTELVINEAAQILRVSVEKLSSPKESLFEMGFDSLTAIELRNVLERRLNLTLPTSLLFDQPHIDLLVQFLESRFESPEDVDGRIADSLRTTGAERLLEEIEGLTDDELDQMLSGPL